MKNRKIYIILFIILYVFVALVSGIHGFAFFSLANTSLLAIMLAVAFEIGQAAVLFSILTDSTQRKKVMPWFLMGILTLVQVMGNVYNSYKYLITNAEANLRFFKEPIFIWTQLPDGQANVILSYIQGAILPIVALLLTSMVAGFLNKKDEEEIEYVEEEPEEIEIEEEPLFEEVPDSDEVKLNKNEFSEPVEYIIPKEKIPENETVELPENTFAVTNINNDGNLESELPIDTEKVIESIPKDDEGNPIGTDMDGGIIGEKGNEGVIIEPPMSKYNANDPEELLEPYNSLSGTKIEEPEIINPAPKMKDSHFLNLKGN